MKKLLVVLGVIVGINFSYGQSRGIMYEYGVSNTNASNEEVFLSSFHKLHAYATAFELANDQVMVHTPFVKLGNNYFSLLTKYDRQLCPIETKKIPIIPSANYPTENVAYNGVSKSDGGFALITNVYPHVLRNYDNQGNLIFSKIISTPFYDTGGPNNFPGFGGDPTRPKLLANPNNNNIYVLFATNNSVYPYFNNGEVDPTINVIEISSLGTVVNSFRLAISYLHQYSDPATTPDPILHDFSIFAEDFIEDVEYVKGANGPSSDRIWVSLTLNYHGSLELNGNTSNNVQASYFSGNYIMKGVAVMDPLGTTGDINVLLTGQNNTSNSFDAHLAVMKNGTVAPEILLLTIESLKPAVYHFRSYTSPIPSDKYRFPFAIAYSNFNTYKLDLKNHQKNILFSVGKYFGIFNPGNLSINLREQDVNNSLVIGNVDFMSKDTNKLYINYSNYTNPSYQVYNPMNFMIKEDIRYFNSTCWSHALGNFTAGTLTPSYYPLVTQLLPLPGVTLANDSSYVETAAPGIVGFKNICLNCSSVFRSSDASIENTENIDIVLHPNPTNNYFELTTERTIEKVEVYSMLGQLVKTFNQQNQYEISGLEKGSYIVKISTNEGTSRKTLIVE
ncbi:T9SS type A sorting domain-containing protein [Flavobacterium sp.]|uniref:T9SS type A sorting domain-containing protein n=1 Tax=Flavobacterium sp. TaxID=239 RepID=UPI00286B6F88|nr:T9SS type A sorting domain-containing protein [Flavobacterium sp.]